MIHWLQTLARLITPRITTSDWVEFAVAVVLAAICWAIAQSAPAFSARLAAAYDWFVRRHMLSIAAIGFFPVIIRLALLPWCPPPIPSIHDEFGHLLIADTLLHGRLANPSHPLHSHFETIYILQQPTYASKYTLGQGLILAAGQGLTGDPWGGVLLAVGLMSAATAWALYGCVSPRWAVFGGLVAALNYGLNPYWIDSFWGGALPAFGGALLLGALFRLRDAPSPRLALLAGIGWSIVWLVRPYESVLLFLFSWAILLAAAVRNDLFRESAGRKRWVSTFVLLAIPEILGGGVTVIHNWSVTGSPTTLPYQLAERLYGVPQSFTWQAVVPEPTFAFPEQKKVYEWQRDAHEDVRQHFLRALFNVGTSMGRFYITRWFFVPLLLALFLLRDQNEHWIRASLAVLALAVIAGALYPFFFPHYLAAYACLIVYLFVRGMQMLLRWSFGTARVGVMIVTLLIIGGFVSGARRDATKGVEGFFLHTANNDAREQLITRLERQGGRHVVLVRYGPTHDFHDEWVYNTAEIDASRIVWARAISPERDQEVLTYYKDRTCWLAEVDGDVARVWKYQAAGVQGEPEFVIHQPRRSELTPDTAARSVRHSNP